MIRHYKVPKYQSSRHLGKLSKKSKKPQILHEVMGTGELSYFKERLNGFRAV